MDYSFIKKSRQQQIKSIVESCIKTALEIYHVPNQPLDENKAYELCVSILNNKTGLTDVTKIKEKEQGFAQQNLKDIWHQYLQTDEIKNLLSYIEQKKLINQIIQKDIISDDDIELLNVKIMHSENINLLMEKLIAKNQKNVLVKFIENRELSIETNWASEAIKHNQKDILDYLLNKKPTLIQESNNYLLYVASFYDNTDLQMFLIDKGATTEYLSVRLSQNPEKYQWLKNYQAAKELTKELSEKPYNKPKNKI